MDAKGVTGVGFLGAGVIVRSEKGRHVHGLTTAACVWVTACVGAACAIAQWPIVVIGVALMLVILVFGGPFERALGSAAQQNACAWRGEVKEIPDIDALNRMTVRALRPPLPGRGRPRVTRNGR